MTRRVECVGDLRTRQPNVLVTSNALNQVVVLTVLFHALRRRQRMLADPLVHGLGLASLIALAPILSVMLLGLLVRLKEGKEP